MYLKKNKVQEHLPTNEFLFQGKVLVSIFPFSFLFKEKEKKIKIYNFYQLYQSQ